MAKKKRVNISFSEHQRTAQDLAMAYKFLWKVFRRVENHSPRINRKYLDRFLFTAEKLDCLRMFLNNECWAVMTNEERQSHGEIYLKINAIAKQLTEKYSLDEIGASCEELEKVSGLTLPFAK